MHDKEKPDTVSSHKSLPRNFASTTNSNKWTLLDTEIIKDKGISYNKKASKLAFDSLYVLN